MEHKILTEADFDWKLQNVVKIESTKMGIMLDRPDDDFCTLSGAFSLGKDNICFDIPNMSAVFLDYAHKSYESTNGYFVFKNFPKKNNNRNPESFDRFIEVLQARIGNVIFSFLALETFMNDSIPQDYEWINEKNKKRDKKFIQEQMSIEPKFTSVLVDIYRKDTIDQKILNKFTEFKSLRDRLTHLKEVDKRSSSGLEDTIWTNLLKKDFPDYALVTKDIIGYFLEDIEEELKPRWFRLINL